MIGYDLDYGYIKRNNSTITNGLFYAIQKNGYISLECVDCSFENVNVIEYIESHYNSILYF